MSEAGAIVFRAAGAEPGVPLGKGSCTAAPQGVRLPALSPARLAAKARCKAFIAAYGQVHGHGPSFDSLAGTLNVSHYQAKRMIAWLIEHAHAVRGPNGLEPRDPTFSTRSILLPEVAPPQVQPKYRHAVTCVRTGAGARHARMETR